MVSIVQKKAEKTLQVSLTESELRYLVGAGFGLLQHIPKESLTTYVNYSADEISLFSKKIRLIMDENDISI